MGTGASSPRDRFDTSLHVGDVVKARLEKNLFFEGVVLNVGEEVTVDFGNHEVKKVKESDCRKKLSWDILELGDLVQVREERGRVAYEARVVEVDVTDDGPVYSCDFGDGDVETRVPPARVRKLASDRSSRHGKFRQAARIIIGLNALKMSVGRGGLTQDADEAKESKLERESSALKLGDVVRATPDRAPPFEGVVEEFCESRGVLVYCKDHASSTWIAQHRVEHLQHWSTIEVGDKVQAKSDEGLWFAAKVLAVGPGGVYTIRWDGSSDDAKSDSKEDDVAQVQASRVRKLASARSRGLQLWHTANKVMDVMSAFRRANHSGRNLADLLRADSKDDPDGDGKYDDEDDDHGTPRRQHPARLDDQAKDDRPSFGTPSSSLGGVRAAADDDHDEKKS